MRCFIFLGIITAALCAAANEPGSLSSSRTTALHEEFRADPKSHTVAAALGKEFLKDGDWEEAVRWTKKAISLSPGTAGYHQQLGKSFLVKLEAEKANPISIRSSAKAAVAAFTEALRLDPELLDARVRRAEIWGALPGWLGGDFDAALREIAIIKSKDPRKAAELLVNCYIKKKKFVEAFEICEQWIATEPHDPTWSHGYGSVAVESGQQLERAETLLRTYLAKPDDPKKARHDKTHYLLGRILLLRGDNEGAKHEFEECLKIDPSHKYARRMLNNITDEKRPNVAPPP